MTEKIVVPEEEFKQQEAVEVGNKPARLIKSVLYTADMFHGRNMEILRPIYRLMKACYGPFGGYTMLTQMTPPKITKDGVSILQHIQFDTDNNVAKAFMDILKKAAARNDMKGGDGTTTTVMLIIAMYEAAARNGVVIPEEVIKLISDEVKKRAVIPTSTDDLLKIARVALNNDDNRTNIIRNLFKDMAENGLSWEDFSIIPVPNKDIQEDKVGYTISNGMVSYSIPVYEKPLDDEEVCLVYVPHQITNGNHLSRILTLATTWLNMGRTEKLMICAPKIERIISEQFINIMRRMEQQQGLKRKIDLIDMVNPVMKENLTASDELATAMGAPIILFDNIPDFDYSVSVDADAEIQAIKKDKGLSKAEKDRKTKAILDKVAATGGFRLLGTIPEDDGSEVVAKKVQMYFATMLKMVPKAIMKIDHTSTKFINKEMHDVMKAKRESRLFEIENLLKNSPINTEEHAALSLRFKNFIQRNVFLNISGSTEEKANLEYDTYRDACAHMETAKQGIIAGMNIGMVKLINGIIDDIPGANRGLIHDILANSYLTLTKALIDNKVGMKAMEGVELDVLKINDMIALICNNGEDICQSFDLIEERPTDAIVTSAYNELNIFKTAVETVNMLMKINQIGLEDHINVNEYTNIDVIGYKP